MSLDTKARIIQTAEQLFSRQGFSATSMRNITSEANVNLAAVNYHFGGKDALAEAVLTQHLDQLNQQRRDRLDKIPDNLDHENKLKAILAAFIEPALSISDLADDNLMQLLVRAYAEKPELLQELLSRRYSGLIKSFAKQLHQCLNHLDSDEFRWRFDFVMGALTFAMADYNTTKKPQISDMEDYTKVAAAKLINFAFAGLSAT